MTLSEKNFAQRGRVAAEEQLMLVVDLRFVLPVIQPIINVYQDIYGEVLDLIYRDSHSQQKENN